MQLKGLEFLEINRSTIAEVKKKLGKPSREYKHQLSDEAAKFDKVLEYHDRKLILRFDRVTNLLQVIDVTAATVLLNNREVILGNSDSTEVKNAFGVPAIRIWKNDLYCFKYPDANNNDFSLFFAPTAIVQRAIFASHKYTSRTFFSH